MIISQPYSLTIFTKDAFCPIKNMVKVFQYLTLEQLLQAIGKMGNLMDMLFLLAPLVAKYTQTIKWDVCMDQLLWNMETTFSSLPLPLMLLNLLAEDMMILKDCGLKPLTTGMEKLKRYAESKNPKILNCLHSLTTKK